MSIRQPSGPALLAGARALEVAPAGAWTAASCRVAPPTSPPTF